MLPTILTAFNKFKKGKKKRIQLYDCIRFIIKKDCMILKFPLLLSIYTKVLETKGKLQMDLSYLIFIRFTIIL
jgi:hypothetical protein